MRAGLAALLMLALAVAAAPARAELLWSQHFDSAALGHPLAYSIYLPPGYHDPRGDPPARYPVVYLLHGVGDSERSYPAWGAVEETADRLITAGQIPPMIIVMPNGVRSWYVDSADVGGPGNYATAIAHDLVDHIDAAYRTIPERDARFVTGHSMGGFGALRFALSEPDRWGAAAAMSSALWSRVAPGFQHDEDRNERIFDVSFGRPFDADRFLALRPRAYIAAAAASGCAPALYMTAGDDDDFNAYRSTFDLAMELRETGLAVDLRITDGGHNWPTWRERALPDVLVWFGSLLAAQPAAPIC